jgi:hypothetical protein
MTSSSKGLHSIVEKLKSQESQLLMFLAVIIGSTIVVIFLIIPIDQILQQQFAFAQENNILK